MAVIDVPFVGQSYHLDDWSIDCQKTLNFYPQIIESGNTPNVAALLPTPGLVKRFELSGAIRGLYALTDYFLCVSGDKLYKITKSDQVTEVGTVASSGIVYFADDSVRVFIVGSSSYEYNMQTGVLSLLQQGTQTGFLGASSVAFLNSRFIWAVPNTGQFQWSNLISSTTTALNYATAEARSDNLVRVVAVNGQLWMLGEKTTEIWSGTANQDLPFQRVSGAYIPFGCIAKDSTAVFGSNLVWLSQSEHGQSQVVMSEGYSAKRISNHAIESEFASYSKVSDAYAFVYQQDGHAFYVLSFPTEKKTWCYDATTNMWHERSFYNIETDQHEHHRALVHCFFNGEHLVGDRSNGLVYRLCKNCPDDNGAMIVRERTTPVLNPQGSRIIFDELELIVQAGQTGNINPILMLEWSDDDGKSWSKDRQQGFGKVGEFKKRIIFRRLGQSYGRVFRLKISDDSRLVILGAKARVRA